MYMFVMKEKKEYIYIYITLVDVKHDNSENVGGLISVLLFLFT